MDERERVRVQPASLEAFCRDVFWAHGVPEEDATICAAVLVAADLRGIASHGVARLPRYVRGLQIGLMEPDVTIEVVCETPVSLLVDGHGGLGAPVSVRTMRAVIAKAARNGVAFGAVRDSNHFGIAGYYAMMALDAATGSEGGDAAGDMIGIAMTNTAALGVPTFGREPMFGTNPIAFAAPADRERAFVLDMATTVVTRGKIEVYNRRGQRLPDGWAVDEAGHPAHDPARVLHNLTHQVGGGILPLGGLGELLGGHKGYGLSVMVDILCGVLSGAAFGPQISDEPGSSARVSHFFGALQISAFRDPRAFRRDMDELLATLRTSPPAVGHDRVYFAGLKEFEHEAVCAQHGVPVSGKVYAQLVATGEASGIAPPSPLEAGDGP